jgi:hypothetical protein
VRTWSPSPTLMAPVRIFPWLTAPRDRRHLAAQTADIQARTHNRLRVEGPHTATAEPSAVERRSNERREAAPSPRCIFGAGPVGPSGLFVR